MKCLSSVEDGPGPRAGAAAFGMGGAGGGGAGAGGATRGGDGGGGGFISRAETRDLSSVFPNSIACFTPCPYRAHPAVWCVVWRGFCMGFSIFRRRILVK
jgi:hypothetical protein